MTEPSCTHGLDLGMIGVRDNAFDQIMDDVKIMEENKMKPMPSKKVQKKARARIEKIHRRHIKPDGKSQLLVQTYSNCATLLLNGDEKSRKDALFLCEEAIHFQALVWNENDYTEKELLLSSAHIMTKRGLILHVAKRIPCSCLDQMKRAAKASQKVALCLGCMEEKPFDDMEWCGGCKVRPYCSATCQLSHWKCHKLTCRDNAELDYVKELREKDGESANTK